MPNRMVRGNKTENHQKTFKMAAKSKMSAKKHCHIDYLTFDIIALKSDLM